MTESFQKPGTIARFANKLFGGLLRLGLGPAGSSVLEVRGRTSGRLHRTPVNPLRVGDDLYLVSPRGETQWVRNLRHSGACTLRHGRRIASYAAAEIRAENKPALLKTYLNANLIAVRGFFSIPADGSLDEFASTADRHPVFRLSETPRPD